MHLIIHTQYYPPELGAPQARLSELAQLMAKAGHRVTVLTAMPSYPQGKVYAGYGGLIQKEKSGDIEIIRTAIYATQKASFLPRLLNYFSFVFSSLLIGGWHLAQADFILTESPPLFLGLAGFLLSRWKKAKWIFNVSDLWPDSALHLGIIRKGFFYNLAARLEAFCYKKAWLVTGQSKTILKDISQRHPQTYTYHFSNGVDIGRFSLKKGEDTSLFSEKNKDIIAIYAGLHGVAQGLEQILLAANKLRSIPDLRIILVGDGPEKEDLIEQTKSLNLKNVTFLDAVPRDQIPQMLADADICLIPLKTHLPGAVPSKIYEAMASGKPIVLVADDEPAEIINSHGVGIVVQPNDITGLASAIERLYKNAELRLKMGIAGQEASKRYFNRSQLVDNFLQFLTEKAG